MRSYLLMHEYVAIFNEMEPNKRYRATDIETIAIVLDAVERSPSGKTIVKAMEQREMFVLVAEDMEQREMVQAVSPGVYVARKVGRPPYYVGSDEWRKAIYRKLWPRNDELPNGNERRAVIHPDDAIYLAIFDKMEPGREYRSTEVATLAREIGASFIAAAEKAAEEMRKRNMVLRDDGTNVDQTERPYVAEKAGQPPYFVGSHRWREYVDRKLNRSRSG